MKKLLLLFIVLVFTGCQSWNDGVWVTFSHYGFQGDTAILHHFPDTRPNLHPIDVAFQNHRTVYIPFDGDPAREWDYRSNSFK